MTAAAAIVLVALVADDPAVLRNAPRDDAPAQATLWRGDWLEVRGETAGFLKVYDHRHERPGYIRPTHGARPPRWTRPARRSWRRWCASCATRTAASRWGSGTRRWPARGAGRGRHQRDPGRDRDDGRPAGAAGVGGARRRPQRDAGRAHRGRRELRREVQVGRRRGDGQRRRGAPRARLCYDGEAWAARAGRAAARRRSSGRGRRCSWRAGPARTGRRWRWRRRKREPGTIAASRRCSRSIIRSRAALPPALLGRVRLRRAEAFAWRAFDEARRGNARRRPRAPRRRPFASWRSPTAACSRPRTSTSTKRSRSAWRRRAGRPSRRQKPAGKRAVDVAFAPRGEGETCVRVVQTAAERQDADRSASAARTAWSGRARCAGRRPGRWRPSPCSRWRPGPSSGSCAAAATATWTFETLTPATADPDNAVGYVESAGFSPDGGRLLVVREARAAGQVTRRFQVLDAATLVVESWAAQRRQAGRLQALERALVAGRNAGAAMKAVDAALGAGARDCRGGRRSTRLRLKPNTRRPPPCSPLSRSPPWSPSRRPRRIATRTSSGSRS